VDFSRWQVSQVMSEQSFISPEEAIAAAKAADVDAYCICSTDANYVELVAPLCSGLKPATMIFSRVSNG
jgi:methylmalonyl-CoA mutase